MTAHRWPDLVTVDLLVRVVEYGSVGKAAQDIGISQASASRRLDVLERELGVPLLSRTVRGSHPTSQGRIVVDWAKTALGSVLDMMSAVEALRKDRRATLRVASSMTIAECLVPTWLMTLRSVSSAIDVSLSVVNSVAVQELVRDDQVEVGFIECLDAPQDLEYREVSRDRLVVVVSPDHPWAKRRSGISFRELAATPLIVREFGSGTRTALEQALAEHGLTVTAQLELSSNAAVRVAVESGLAPAVLSYLAVDGEVRSGRLVELPVVDLPLERPLRAVWQRRNRLTQSGADLITIATSTEASKAIPRGRR